MTVLAFVKVEHPPVPTEFEVMAAVLPAYAAQCGENIPRLVLRERIICIAGSGCIGQIKNRELRSDLLDISGWQVQLARLKPCEAPNCAASARLKENCRFATTLGENTRVRSATYWV